MKFLESKKSLFLWSAILGLAIGVATQLLSTESHTVSQHVEYLSMRYYASVPMLGVGYPYHKSLLIPYQFYDLALVWIINLILWCSIAFAFLYTIRSLNKKSFFLWSAIFGILAGASIQLSVQQPYTINRTQYDYGGPIERVRMTGVGYPYSMSFVYPYKLSDAAGVWIINIIFWYATCLIPLSYLRLCFNKKPYSVKSEINNSAGITTVVLPKGLSNQEALGYVILTVMSWWAIAIALYSSIGIIIGIFKGDDSWDILDIFFVAAVVIFHLIVSIILFLFKNRPITRLEKILVSVYNWSLIVMLISVVCAICLSVAFFKGKI